MVTILHVVAPEEGATRRNLASLPVRGARSWDHPTTAATSLATSARAAARSLTTFTCRVRVSIEEKSDSCVDEEIDEDEDR